MSFEGPDEEPITKQEHVALPPIVEWEGRYVLGPVLGRGGMSVVHEAHDLLLGRTVALKELRPSTLPSADVLEREARALAAVDHPNVVRVYCVRPDATPPFLVMERARGRSLSSLLSEGAMPLARAMHLLQQIGAGLDALHIAGITHGDVKPGNVIVDQDDSAKLIDVGLGPFLERLGPGEVAGTPTYMAPERARGNAAARGDGHLGDVYSFGVLCFEMLTGRLPFEPTSTDAVLRAHISERAPRPSTCAGLSAEFDRPLASALAKRPQDRPASCTELVSALERASLGADASGRRLRVLIADDDLDQREMLADILEAQLPGASIVVCASGQAALEALSGKRTDLAILDLHMPGVSGMDLVRHIRARTPSTAIVIVTGEGSGAERRTARELGVRRFLVKPYELDELVGALREALAGELPTATVTAARGAA